MKPVRVAYAGYDRRTLALLAADPEIEIAAVNLIKELAGFRSLNPADLIFSAAYALRRLERMGWLERALTLACRLLAPLMSRPRRSYVSYLRTLTGLRAKLLDFEDSAQVAAFARERRLDLIVVNNWWLLPREILGCARLKPLNVHPSRLPQYRGSLPTLWSLKNGDRETALTYMLIDESVDGGEILAQYPFPVEPHDDSLSLESKIEGLLTRTLTRDLKSYARGEAGASRQDPSLASKTARYHPYMLVDWRSERAAEIVNKINLYPYLWAPDRCYAYLGGRKVSFGKASLGRAGSNLEPGEYALSCTKLRIGAEREIEIPLLGGLCFGEMVRLIARPRGRFDAGSAA